MKILKVEYGERSISEWIDQELKRFHKEKYGEECELVQIDSEDVQCG